MKITEIYIEMGVKKTKDYQSCTNSVGLRGELEADDDRLRRSVPETREFRIGLV